MTKYCKKILLLTIECMRADHTHYGGYLKQITPTLDTLARLGLSFSNAMVTYPWTPASFKSILASRYPLMDGGILSIKQEMENLPTLLQDQGFINCAVVPPGWFSAILPQESFDVSFTSDRIKRAPQKLINLLGSFRNVKDLQSCSNEQKKRTVQRRDQTKKGMYSHISEHLLSYLENFKEIFPPFARFYKQKANLLLEKYRNKDLFLWVHFPDPHEPYYPNSPFLTFSNFLEIKRASKNSRKDHATRKPGCLQLTKKEVDLLHNLYDEKIRIVDNAIKGILQKLVDLGLLKNTLTIITGDHGQQFMEHGEYGHGLHLYNEVVNVPLILYGPNVGKGNIETPVSLIDIAPTILDFLDYKQNTSFIGSSLLNKEQRRKNAEYGIISEEARKKRKDHSLEGGELRVKIKERKIALITPRWKYIYKEEGTDELFDIRKDPMESKNIIEKKEVSKQLKKRILHHVQFEERQSRKWKLKQRIKGIKERLSDSSSI